MNQPRTNEELVLEIVILKRQGLSQRAIGRRLGVGRKKVGCALAKHKKQRECGHDILDTHQKRKRGSKLDAWIPFMLRKLEKYPKLTAVRMLEELREEGYAGGITVVRERVRQLRPKPQKEPVIRFETEPGLQGQMDWSPYTIRFRRTGKQKVLCFSYILGYSRRQYIDFTTTRSFYTMIRRHQDAFHYFGGVTEQCLYDGEKTVILRWEAGRPVYHPGFVAFLTHYGCRPIGCLPGRARTKGKIEQPFQNVEGNLLNGREFDDLDDLRRCARWWLANWSDTHPHRTTGQPPLERFVEAEKQALKPLPIHPYDSSEVVYVVGRDDGFVQFETNLYSMPFAYMFNLLILKADDDEVFIYDPDVKEIGHHRRLPKGLGLKSELCAHRESSKYRYGLAPIRETFLALGSYAGDFLVGLMKTHPKRTGFYARRILGLLEKYEPQSINMSFKHAMRYHAYDVASIENILKAKFQPRALEHWTTHQPLETHWPHIEQRSLDEYLFLNR